MFATFVILFINLYELLFLEQELLLFFVMLQTLKVEKRISIILDLINRTSTLALVKSKF